MQLRPRLFWTGVCQSVFAWFMAVIKAHFSSGVNILTETSNIRHSLPKRFRLHSANPPVNMDVNWTLVQVQACNPLAPAGQPWCYYHSKTALYNGILFLCWDEYMVVTSTFNVVCLWMNVTSQACLEFLFSLKFQRWARCVMFCCHWWANGGWRSLTLALSRPNAWASWMDAPGLLEWIACWARVTCGTKKNWSCFDTKLIEFTC